ncbi:nuclear transport factor 2 family protein [Streptomyces sp. enrichment culture]|uniref:nuclear transport factor 2 family protein n=1 Tax=Streptomyces sp. enrichment culture TaxID=1795815 RepID=UPI003F5541D7
MLDAWLRLWNGDCTQAPGIISPDFTVHAALLDGGDGSIRGADGLVAWIAPTHAAFPDPHFSLQTDPLIAGHGASVRWRATGTYAGGFLGAKAQPGGAVSSATGPERSLGVGTGRCELGGMSPIWRPEEWRGASSASP